MMESERIAFADLQGFIVDGVFIVKELSYSINVFEKKYTSSDQIQSHQNHYIFAAPYAWSYLDNSCRKQANWLTKNHHGFHWTDGDLSYEEIYKCVEPLLHDDLIIYVKGQQKISWLHELCKSSINCINIEDIGCTVQLSDKSLTDNSIFHCGHHNIFKHCGFRNVKIIKKWYLHHRHQHHE